MKIVALGWEIDLAIEDPELAATIAGVLVDLRSDDHAAPADEVRVSGRGPWRIVSEAHSTVAESQPRAVSAVLTAINLTAVAATPHLACHAAVVARAGSALVIPGPSGEGKTTLTAALLQRGWAYISDEALVLRRGDGRVEAYPRPLALSAWAVARLGEPDGIEGHGERIVLPRAIGGEIVDEVQRIGQVVCLDRDGSTPRLSRTHRADAIQELLRRSFNHYRDPVGALRLLADSTVGATTWRLHLGDPVKAADLLTHAAM